MKKLIPLLFVMTLLLSSCTFDFRDIGRTGVTTGVVYAAGGIVPAIVAGATTSTYDVIVEKEKDLAKVKNAYQASVVLGKQAMSWTIIGFAFFLLCATFCRVWLTGMLNYIKSLFKKSK